MTELLNESNMLNQTPLSYPANDIFDVVFTNRKYHKEVSPLNGYSIGNRSDVSLEVIIAIQLLYVLDLDVAKQSLSVYAELEIEWQDGRLTWVPSNFSGVDFIWVLCDELWTTDLTNTKSLSINEIYPDRLKQCKVSSNGSIRSNLAVQMESACPIDVQEFPFDHQTCLLPFVTGAYEPKTFNLTGRLFTKYIGLTPEGNGEWHVINLTFAQFTEVKSSRSNDEYNILVFTLTMRREPSFYIYVMTLPCFLLTFLSIIGCFWTPNAREEQLAKLSIALTSMMSMTTFIQMVSEQIPKTQKFPLLGIFVLICVILISVSCVILVTFPEKLKTKVDPKETRRRKLLQEKIRHFVFSQHFALFVLFQTINIANFVVFISYWV